jgi:hypothetical protein
MVWLKALRRAFATSDDDVPELPPAQQQVIDRLCREIVRRQLTAPAVLFLEMSRPLGFLGAQSLHFFTPLLAALCDASAPRQFAQFLERPGAIESLIRQVEELARRGGGSPDSPDPAQPPGRHDAGA